MLMDSYIYIYIYIYLSIYLSIYLKVQTRLPHVNARRPHHARFVGSKEVTIGAHFQLASPAVRLRSSLRPLCLGNCSYIQVPPL